jgi:glycosyltransferase involved in cell wall biosynthesis
MPRTLQIESWRGLPHSYAIVNQFQCLQLLRRPDLLLRHVDVPYFNPQWKPVRGLLPSQMENAIADIPPPSPGEIPDLVYRLGFPYSISPSPAKRTVVFGTAEFRCVPSRFITGGRTLLQACGECDAVIVTPSRWSREGFIHSGAEPDRVKLVPHGVDTAIFHPVEAWQREQFRFQLGWSGFVFLTLGSLTLNKGLERMLKAFAIVAQRHPQVRLIIKGLGALYPSLNFLKSQSTRLTQAELALIQPRLMYVDKTLSFAEVARLYQAADAYVSPYSAEGFNMPVLEAVACGLPVICTAGGSTDDFTGDDYKADEFALRIQSKTVPMQLTPDCGGFALQPDFNHLVHQMMTAVESPDLGARARAAGPAFVRRGFTWEQVCARLMEVLFD